MHLNLWHLKQASDCLKQGGLIGYATEAVFGFGCDPSNHDALVALRELKSRSRNKGFILVADCPERLSGYVGIADEQLEKLNQHPNHPTTWLVEKGPLTDDLITGDFPTVAVRICQHPQVKALCQTAQMPVISTSANFANREPVKTYTQLKLQFHDWLDYCLPGNTLGLTQPSQIIDFNSGKKVR